MPDIVAPEAHPNDRSYVGELSFGFSTQDFSTVVGYIEDLRKHKTAKIGWWVLARDNTELTKGPIR